MVPEHVHRGGRVDRVGRRGHQRVLVVGLWAVAAVRAALMLFLAQRLHNILVGPALVRLIVFCVLQ